MDRILNGDKMDITIRTMELQDIPQLVRIANQSFVELGRLPGRFGPLTIKFLKEFPDWLFVAQCGAKVVGFLVGRPPDKKREVLSISWIATDPAWQGKGVGGMLLEAYENQCRKHALSKIYIETPFAGDFYEKHGYRAIGAEYRMIKELLGKSITRPAGREVSILGLEDLPALLDRLEKSEALEFLDSFLRTYQNEQDKSLLLGPADGVEGILIGETDPYNRDLVRAIFCYYRNISSLELLLLAFEYICSTKGVRWAGFAPASTQAKELSERLGWEESHLPSYWVAYKFQREL